MQQFFIILGIILFLIFILAYPITKIISKAWYKQKLKEIDFKLKGENK